MTRTWTLIAISILAAFSVSAARAETRVLFSSQESVEGELVLLIGSSQSSIEIALFELRAPGLARALEEARRRGVHVRLVLDASHRQEDIPVGEVRWLGGKTPRGRGVMHNKFALFDQARVVTGSYNWTPGAEHSNFENVLVTDDSKAVKAYMDEFEALWQRALPHPASGHPLPSGEGLGVRQSLSRNYWKTIRIKVSKPVTKRRHKAHTYRP